ncbi:dicarboxylate/amino acid:cation symporter [Pseudidiomarina sp. 1APP75-27a]|uniref:dicarboxylate/amino acid:cation symporter n=1 Tax=Pseudidiomarina terrestris TaxID=2820060 RepID=UPI002B061496|nr:dicarboxylate/amino acid:cation symporter [Pseudidiomarina sp. 1APP75-27a]MEA3587443.1 dicarboxylate/amino acid:cation symporter [Pseudidiomarina sp. 1APP75-27a]
MLKTWFAIPFWQRVLGAFVLGVAAGLLVPDFAVALKPLGDLFIQALKMLVAPLIFCAIVNAILQFGEDEGLGKIGAKTVGLFLLTAVLASVIGLAVGSLLDVSPTQNLVASPDYQEKDVPGPIAVFLNMIPSNPFAALSEGKILQIVVFAALVGIAIRQVGQPAQALGNVLKSGAQVMYRITKMVLELTPFGVLGLMAWVVGSYGLSSLAPLAAFVGAIYLACFIHIVFVYGSMVRLAGMSPWFFFKSVFSAQLVAYTTCSSFGTIPAAHQAITERLRVKKSYASFVLPLGATINMDGCGGIYPAIAAIFIAQLYGVPLEWMDYLLITGTATLASIGTAGVPGTALVMLTVTLNVVGLPLEGIAFIAAIDRIIDMARTATNVTGDMAVAVVLGREDNGAGEEHVGRPQEQS